MLIVRGLIGGLFQIMLLSAFLLIPAGLLPEGTWFWHRGLLFFAGYGLAMASSIIWLARAAPESLEARLMAPTSREQPKADRIVTALLIVVFLAWFVFIPVDVFSLQLLPKPPFALSLAGASMALGGYLIAMRAIYQNQFAKPIVEDQTESGQTLVDTGLYALVRHPLYMGILPFVAGTAIWLESYAGAIAGLAVVAVLVARILVEERTLRETLPGYDEYTERVRYRLLPYVW